MQVDSIDGTRVSTERNESIFVSHSIIARAWGPSCLLDVAVAAESSSSGYKVKLRMITAQAVRSV